jgi:penicillin amidase
VSGRRTCDRRPILANDPHLDLLTPPFFYPVRLAFPGGRLRRGRGQHPGHPVRRLRAQRRIAWGGVVNQFDFTDVYREQVVGDPGSPSGLSTVHQGRREPVLAIPETVPGQPARRRRARQRRGRAAGHGRHTPLDIGRAPPERRPDRVAGPRRGTAISVQYVGFGPTRELDGFRLLNLARDLRDFEAALRFIDVSGINLVYADVEGAVGFFSTGEVPLREDLQRGRVRGAPPLLVRDGTGGNEWIAIPEDERPAGQAIRYRVLPRAELPRIVDPPAGYVVTANNDPLGVTLDNDPLNQTRRGGDGILYLGGAFNIGIRAERITDLLRRRTAAGCVTVEDTKRIQADVVLLDAQVFTPRIVEAFRNAGARPRPASWPGAGATPA